MEIAVECLNMQDVCLNGKTNRHSFCCFEISFTPRKGLSERNYAFYCWASFVILIVFQQQYLTMSRSYAKRCSSIGQYIFTFLHIIGRFNVNGMLPDMTNMKVLLLGVKGSPKHLIFLLFWVLSKNGIYFNVLDSKSVRPQKEQGM